MSIMGFLICLMVFCLIMFGICIAAAIFSYKDNLYGLAAFEMTLALINVMYFIMGLMIYQAIK